MWCMVDNWLSPSSQHERKMLNVKRLDLDASRAKAKKAQQGGGEKLQTVSCAL